LPIFRQSRKHALSVVGWDVAYKRRDFSWLVFASTVGFLIFERRKNEK